MPCYSPLKALARYNKTEHKYEILKFQKKGEPELVASPPITEILSLPCGQCIGCRLDYSAQWATRIMLEAKEYEYNYFFTLTYNDENLPVLQFSNYEYTKSPQFDETGEITDFELYKGISHPLVKRDLQLFFKSIREYFRTHFNHTGIRFFACGEYGGQTQRPHYHICMFNLPIPDLVLYKRNFNGDILYTSDLINSFWKKGYVVIGDLTFESAAYVARYIMKKQKGDNSSYYLRNGLVPEFTLMSRRPGIGLSAYEKEKDNYFRFDKIILSGSTARIVKVPKFFDKKYREEHPLEHEVIRKKRLKYAENNNIQKLMKTSLNSVQYAEVCKNNKISLAKCLPRML